MSVVVTSVLDDLHSLNLGKKALADVIASGSSFNTYEMFVEFYLFEGYVQTVSIFRSLNSANLQAIFNVYQSIMIGYMCFVLILFWLLLFFVYKSKVYIQYFHEFYWYSAC